MKHFLKILLAASIVALAAGIMAVSCGKVAGGGDNNTANNSDNNSGSGSSGGSDGNGNNTPGPVSTPGPGSIAITNVDTTVAKVKDETNILIKLSAFPTSAITTAGDFDETYRQAAGTRKKAFEIINDKAKEGMVLVGKGSVLNASAITTVAVGRFVGAATDNDGIHIVPEVNQMPPGLSFVSVFANKTNPTTTADAAANAEPFSFSHTTQFGVIIKPVFWCIASVPAITRARAATDKLEGGHKAECYVGSWGDGYGNNNTRIGNWFGAADPFKREIQVAVSAIKTDGKTIGDLMPGANAAAKVTAFDNGIDATEMAGVLTASGHGTPPFKKFNIKIVNDTDFTAP